MGRSKRSILTLRRKIEKDRIKTEQANLPGGRYWKPGVAEKIATITKREYR